MSIIYTAKVIAPDNDPSPRNAVTELYFPFFFFFLFNRIFYLSDPFKIPKQAPTTEQSSDIVSSGEQYSSRVIAFPSRSE